MIPDIKIKDYYINYVNNIEKDIEEYNNKLEKINILIKNNENIISENKNILSQKFNLNLINYKQEWIKQEYNPKENLYKDTLKLITAIVEDKEKYILLHLLNYSILLKQKNEILKLLEITSKRKDITFGEFNNYVHIYYKQVQACLLNGYGYRYGKGLGTLIINYWKVDKSVGTKYVDLAKTNAKRAQLLRNGIKLYDEEEAEEYKRKGLEYDGVKYITYKDDSYYFEFLLINSIYFGKRESKFKVANYVHKDLKKYTQKEVADKFVNSFEDIINLPMDVKAKLNIMIYKEPNRYLNFIRNADLFKYEHRKNNCKN